MPAGRPTAYKPEYCEQLVKAARETGISPSAFAGLIGVSAETISNWKDAHVEFLEAVKIADRAREWFHQNGLATNPKGVIGHLASLKHLETGSWRESSKVEVTLPPADRAILEKWGGDGK